jgi:DNA repair exonuclease SbcCD ATPase subunit
VDDGLIESDKDGGLIYFWSFPSNVISRLQTRVQEKEQRLAHLKNKIETLNEKKTSLSQSQEGSEERTENLKILKELRENVAGLEVEVKLLQENDPEVCETYKAAANRWADNVYSVVSWLKDRFGLEEAAINKQFGVPEEFEYFQ